MAVNNSNGTSGYTGASKGYSTANSRTVSAPMTMANANPTNVQQQQYQQQPSRPSSQTANPNSINVLSKHAVVMRDMDKPSSVSAALKFNKTVYPSFFVHINLYFLTNISTLGTAEHYFSYPETHFGYWASSARETRVRPQTIRQPDKHNCKRHGEEDCWDFK